MRKFFSVLFVLILSFSLVQAQSGRGNIYGKVVDADGNPLPGVAVTLTGSRTAPVSVVTGPKGLFRFMTLAPAEDYCITASIQGFKTEKMENCEVKFGANTDVTITMELGGIEEEVTVTAERPVIDKKTTEVGMLLTEETLQELPTTRDVWMAEKMTPGVYSRYWNIGGQESLQQDAGSARGDPDHYMTTYSVDGINITSLAAKGSAAIYYNYDTIDELNIIVGGAADVTQQTSGLSNNVIMKRGRNTPTLSGRVYFSDDKFQWNNHSQKLIDAGIPYMSKINQLMDFGVNMGFPIVRDKAWFFVAYDYQDTKLWNVYGTADNFKAWSYDFKLNLQLIPQNRFEAYIRGNPKRSEGEDATPELPNGLLMGEIPRLGNPLYKITDEHTFGDDLYLSAKWVHLGGWSQWTPMIDTERVNLAYWNYAGRIWEGSASRDLQSRPHTRAQVIADYFNQNLFGVAHEIRFGGEWAKHSTKAEDGFAGNVFVNYNYNSPTVDYDGDGSPDIYPGIRQIDVERGGYSSLTTKALALFAQDTITINNFNIRAGLRYDHQVPYVDPIEVFAVERDNPAWANNFSAAAINAIDGMIPSVKMEEIKGYDSAGNTYSWTNLSPRFSVTWDIGGNGKNVLKFYTAKYSQWMESGYASRWRPGGTGGWMNFWWLDGNSDGIYDVNELYWHRTSDYGLYRAFDDSGNFIGDLADAAGVLYGSYDPQNPQKTTDPYRLIDGATGAPRTIEVGFTYERELFRDFALTVSTCYRIYDRWNWNLSYYPDTGQLESSDWYMSAGLPPATIDGIPDTKESSNHEWYVLKPEYGYTPWTFEKPRPDYHINYYGVDFILNKRLSNRWMLNASVTLGKQEARFGDEGMIEPTQTWALEGRGTTGRGEGETVRAGRYDTPLWMVKASGLYQLPWYDIDVSFTFNARQGRKVQEYYTIVDYSLPNPRSQSNRIWLVPYGTEHSATIALLNFRVQKRLNFRDVGRITFSVDLFNVFNASTIHWRYPKNYGTYTVQGQVLSPNPSFYHAEDNFGPRVAKLGIRFTF